MVQELRRIILSKKELIAALESHNRMVPNFLPAKRIYDLSAAGNDSIAIELQASMDDYQLSAQLIIRDTRLLMPVIRFCIENNVWLPAGGHKSIEIIGDGVALCVAIDTDIDCAYCAPMRLARGAIFLAK
jgi:hypothetical protein